MKNAALTIPCNGSAQNLQRALLGRSPRELSIILLLLFYSDYGQSADLGGQFLFQLTFSLACVFFICIASQFAAHFKNREVFLFPAEHLKLLAHHFYWFLFAVRIDICMCFHGLHRFSVCTAVKD